jgi:hypothetical protein
MNAVRRFSFMALISARYEERDTRVKEVSSAAWRKSSLSTYNGNCVEIARLPRDRVGVRDTKDHGAGPVLAFTQDEWSAFLSGAKAGEFDSI